MEFIFELLVQLVLELLLQGVFELGGRGIVLLFNKDAGPIGPWLRVCGYLAMGGIVGCVSLWLVPMHLLSSPLLQVVNLAMSPLLLGLTFEVLGRWEDNNDKRRYAVDRFSYGFTFALTMGLIRYFLAT